MEGHQQINETESESRQIGARARRAVKQIAPTGARQRTKAALLLIDCRISPIFPGGTAERQWQMEADWTERQRKGEEKEGETLKKEKEKRRSDPETAGYSTAAHSMLNKAQWSRGVARAWRGAGGSRG